jgi:hypothetical protein
LLATLAAALLAVFPASAAGNSIAVGNPAPLTATSGVWFTVTAGGNRNYDEIGISCDNGYSTRITVQLDANGAGTSGTVYPPTGHCTATLEIPKFINKFRVLASVGFTVGP